MTKTSSEAVPEKMQVTYHSIISITDAVCQAHLTDEYAELCRKLTAELCQHQPSILEQGEPRSWAGGILYTIGRVNFLFDSDQTPHMKPTQLYQAVGINQSTASLKSTAIRDRLDIMDMDPKWTLPSQLDQNPLAWLVHMDGMYHDMCHAPRFLQEKAFHQGLIPYIPKDRDFTK